MEKLFDLPPANKGKPYTTEELELIFSLTPTKKNAELLWITLKRNPEAIMQQRQRALLTDKAVKEKWHNPEHMPNRKMAKKLWWIRTA